MQRSRTSRRMQGLQRSRTSRRMENCDGSILWIEFSKMVESGEWTGLHFAALKAPHPTGTCAEHMLSVPRRVLANKLHPALSAFRLGALLAAQEKWQAEAHQDGRASVLGLRQAACEQTPGHPPFQGAFPALARPLPLAPPGSPHTLSGGLGLDRSEWQHQSESVTSLTTGATFTTTEGLSRVTCLAPSKVRWSWGKRATRF